MLSFFCRSAIFCFALISLEWCSNKLELRQAWADEVTDDETYRSRILPLLTRYCFECHSVQDAQADVDLSRFRSTDDIARAPKLWVKVREMLDSHQMPPREAKMPSDSDRSALQQWVRSRLQKLAAADAGDPGPVTLRRLNNAEYTNSIRQLTGISSLNPASEFPSDGAAGEGFTNVGGALVMSPSLVSKFLEAAKQIADHTVLTPASFRFSPSTTRRDWSEECLANIRAFYRKYSSSTGATNVNLQGIQFETNQGGRLPLNAYIAAALQAREQGIADEESLRQYARTKGLSAKYFTRLSTALTASNQENVILERLHARWKECSHSDFQRLLDDITKWQMALWKFNVIGHVVRDAAGERSSQKWMEGVSPFVNSVELRHKLMDSPNARDYVLYLSAGDCGDGNADDWVVWQNPRLVAPGRPDLPLAQVASVMQSLPEHRRRIASHAAACLNKIATGEQTLSVVPATDETANFDSMLIQGWRALLGYSERPTNIEQHIQTKSESIGGYDFIRGWTGPDALSVIANSSDQHVRIPGNMIPRSVAVHPTPKLRAAIAWRSPVSGPVSVSGVVQHAHPECGNGVHWILEYRRGAMKQIFASGVAHGNGLVSIPDSRMPNCRVGDLIVLSIGPRDGNHSCDLTRVDLTINTVDHQWDLSEELSQNILAGNPHSDSMGNKDIWHFFSEPDKSNSEATIPMGSLLALWIQADSLDQKRQLADQIQQLLERGADELSSDSADRRLYQQLLSITSPLMVALRKNDVPTNSSSATSYGIERERFGKHPSGATVPPMDLCVHAPAVLEIRLPPEVSGYEFVTTGTIHSQFAAQGSAQLQLGQTKPTHLDLSPNVPIVVADSSRSRKKFEEAFDGFRELFPAALCYEKIVPVDEVVTLTLFFREDEHLQRLMLEEDEIVELNRLWDELLYISQEPYLLVAAFEQIAEYATQDRPDKVTEFSPLRKPILDRSDRFRHRLELDELSQLNALIQFANKAYRHDLNEKEERLLRSLYSALRSEGLDHTDAFKLTLARILISSQFLFRTEQSLPDRMQHPVSSWELATRLSYFLWSCGPDEELLRLARSGEILRDDILKRQVHRMLTDSRVRNLAIEFAGQWLNIRDFQEHDQKSEQFFPTFGSLKEEMFEETIQFFTDLFQRNGSVISVLTADYCFLNAHLADHYAIPGIEGSHWRRVEGAGNFHRGGVLSMASILSAQSGASRTSPILRGNWMSEVLLGERLPRPPKNVPALPETSPVGLTERELIAKHSSDPSCAQCHAKIDPLGFSLENFDAIGRYRTVDSQGLQIDTQSPLSDGTVVQGFEGIRAYLAGKRKKDFLKQVGRKLLGYALGRSIQLSDEPLIEKMMPSEQHEDIPIHSLIETIVLSKQFREIRGQLRSNQNEGDHESVK